MTTKTVSPENTRFCFGAQMAFARASEAPNALRTFAGVAYSGEVIPDHWYWGNVIFDLTSMSVPDKLPALLDHENRQRAGFVTENAIDIKNGLSVKGTLLSNEHGSAVAKDSDDGFPWQMSVHIEPQRIEDIKPGVSVNINGRSLVGPLTVFRDSAITEVSFTAMGWDKNTSARAMSRNRTKPSGESTMTPEEEATLRADLAAAQTRATTAEANAAAFSKQNRLLLIAGLFSKLGKEYKADDPQVVALAAMDDAAYNAASSFALTVAPTQATTTAAPAAPAAAPVPAGTPTAANLYSHQATSATAAAPAATPAGGAVTSFATSADCDNALVANAKKRSEKFAQTAQPRRY